MAQERTSETSQRRPWLARSWWKTTILDSRYVAEPEWLIGLGRLVTSSFAMIAIHFDPTQPGRLADEAKLITLAYVGFSILVLIPIRRPVDSKLHIFTHAIDIIVLGWLLHLTDELTSPFFAFFHFTLLAATIRWGMTGALLGALALEALLFLIGLPDLEDGVSELNLMIMRSAYFLVAAFMLGYFGAYRNRSRYRLARLAGWPRIQPSLKDSAWLEGILTHAAGVVGAARLIVVWQDVDELVGTVALYHSERLVISSIRDPRAWAAIGDALLDQPDVAASGATAAFMARLTKVAPDLAAIPGRFDHLCSAAFSGLRYRGRLLVVDARYPNEEVESLARIIASRISYELERMALMHEVASSARVQERVRLARDLHDGVLQDLTAASLKLKSAARRVPNDAEMLLGEVATIMNDQQRRIRRFVEDTRSGDEPTRLPDVLAQHVEQLEKQWPCEIHLAIDPPDLRLSAGMSGELAQIISEATSNAVRHGAANRIDFALTRCDDMLRLGIVDNGIGIADDPTGELRKPSSLGARVADLAGQLSIRRRRPGFALMIELPVT